MKLVFQVVALALIIYGVALISVLLFPWYLAAPLGMTMAFVIVTVFDRYQRRKR